MKIPQCIKRNYDDLKKLYDLVGLEEFSVKSIRDKYPMTAGKATSFLIKTYDANTCILKRTKESTYIYQFND